MKINKDKLRVGLWFTDWAGNVIEWDGTSRKPEGAVYSRACFPLEVLEHCYRIREDGGYGEKDKLFTSGTSIWRSGGRLAVAMVNSGEYELDEALSIIAHSCERCLNVLFNKYLPSEDEGYEEGSDEWKKCNTECDFCRE